MYRKKLDQIYREYNKFEYIHPDPLEFLFRFPHDRDREIVGLIAAALAYGRVSQILKSVSAVLSVMGDTPHDYVTSREPADIAQDFETFIYRFTKGRNMTGLLCSMKRILAQYGSLEACFLRGYSNKHETILPAMGLFMSELSRNGDTGYLTTDPAKGSACKRHNLFLRWMVREDRVDPGGWAEVPAGKLIVPLDTHMYRIGTMMGFTNRKQANMKTALEITKGFRRINPEDPVKYDFCLTRFGIRNELSVEDLGLHLQ